MHVGWVARFAAPADGRDFERLRDHVARRLGRAPRFRQRLAEDPLGVAEPLWVDDQHFRADRHLHHATAGELGEVVDAVMSRPLARDRPLWEMWIADRLDDGSIGLVGKAHHCMVDGIAAVELGTLLLDPTPDPPEDPSDDWEPEAVPPGSLLAARALLDRVRQELTLARIPAHLLASPGRLLRLPGDALRTAQALAGSLLPPAPPSPLNRAGSPLRHLATAERPLDDLRRIKRRHGTTVNDVLLAAAAGALGRFLAGRGDEAVDLKAMVPVSVRDPEEDDGLGNRISFVFLELPCHETDPVERLAAVHEAMTQRKEESLPERSDALLRAAALTPRTVQHVLSRVMASPRTFNLVVSNIPGPREPLFMDGCELIEAFPVVPLADEHALSIGMTTVRDRACFGLYADRATLPDADDLAAGLDAAIDELLDAR
jgi:WS/DGAT/MGAT family acyltransferase